MSVGELQSPASSLATALSTAFHSLEVRSHLRSHLRSAITRTMVQVRRSPRTLSTATATLPGRRSAVGALEAGEPAILTGQHDRTISLAVGSACGSWSSERPHPQNLPRKHNCCRHHLATRSWFVTLELCLLAHRLQASYGPSGAATCAVHGGRLRRSPRPRTALGYLVCPARRSIHNRCLVGVQGG